MPDQTYPGPENIQQHVLPNGITVLLYENFASESVVVDGILPAGALVEDRAHAGLASLTASMLMRGNHTWDFAQIYEALESVGAGLDFSSGRHVTEFSGHSLVEDLDLLLAILAASLREPTFAANQLELVRGQMMTSLQIRANDTRRMASLAFSELLYQAHPYAQSVAGYEDSIPRLSRDDLAQYHADYFGPRQMILGLVGAVKADDALRRIEAVLGDWRSSQQAALPPVPDAPRPAETRRVHVPMPDKSQADIVLGLPGPRRAAPDYLDAKLMNTILGVFGMMGRIGATVREAQGLAYYAYSHLQGGVGPSPWTASAGVAPENVDRAIDSIVSEIGRIQQEAVPAEELVDSQAFSVGSMPVSLETNSSLANAITDMAYYGLGLDYLQRYPDMIWDITPARIQAAAQKHLSTSQLAIAVAGPDGAG